MPIYLYNQCVLSLRVYDNERTIPPISTKHLNTSVYNVNEWKHTESSIVGLWLYPTVRNYVLFLSPAELYLDLYFFFTV